MLYTEGLNIIIFPISVANLDSSCSSNNSEQLQSSRRSTLSNMGKELSTKLYLTKDFHHVVLQIVGTPLRSVIYTFPKFLVKFVRDVCLFPQVFHAFLQRFLSNNSVFCRIELSLDNEPWVMDDASFVPQPYFNKDIGPERLNIISLALQRKYGPSAPDHFFKRASVNQSENDPPAGYVEEEEDDDEEDASYDSSQEYYAQAHENELADELTSKLSEISLSEVFPSDAPDVSFADESAMSFECVTPTAPSPIATAGSGMEALTAGP